MPNYLYKCSNCKDIIDINLPMSFEPTEMIFNSGHKKVCVGRFKRIMRKPGAVKGFKVFAGDWFKKEYGFDIGEKETTKAEFQRDVKLAGEKHKRDMEC